MKTSRKILVVITVLLFLAFVFNFAHAANAQKQQPGTSSKEKAKGGMGLTPEQLEKLKALHIKFDDVRENMMIEIQIRKLELAKLLKAEEPEQKKIEAKLDEINQIEGQLHKTMIAEYFEIRKILTPEQRRFFVRKIIKKILGGGRGIAYGKHLAKTKPQFKNK